MYIHCICFLFVFQVILLQRFPQFLFYCKMKKKDSEDRRRFETELFMFYFFYGALVNVQDSVPLKLASAFWKPIGTLNVKRLGDFPSITTVSPVLPEVVE